MIKSFKSKALRNYWTNAQSAGIKPEWLKRTKLILSTMDTVRAPSQLDLPGLAFHALKGDRKGDYAVTVGGNWRITFAWADEDAIDVDLEDYHGK